MTDAIDRYMCLLVKQIGYKETGKNITKYGKFFDTPAKDGGGWQYFNTRKQGAQWCSLINHYCMYICYGSSVLRKVLNEPSAKNNCGAGVSYLWDYMKAKGLAWKASDKTRLPQKGDFIFFNNLSHVGTVESLIGSIVHTIEGNKGDCCKRQSYNISNKTIYGYARPNWDAVKEVKVDIEMPELRYGMKGEEVKTVQRILHMIGYKKADGKIIGVDGVFGDNTRECVMKFQKDHGISQDGAVGKKTWSSLLSGTKY